MEMKCPTVGHGKPMISIILGGFFHSPMANPPICASRSDARNDRGVRPLRMENLDYNLLKVTDDETD